MDPLSITSASVAILANIVNLSKQITSFVLTAKDARKDMDAVSRELTSLSLSLTVLRDEEVEAKYPEALQQYLKDVLGNCEQVTVQMQDLLESLSSANIGRKIQWAFTSRDQMNALRSSLEAHKAAIGIALDMSMIPLLTTINETTRSTVQDTTQIRKDTAQISSLRYEIMNLRSVILHLEERDGRRIVLDRFFAHSDNYAQSVIDPVNGSAADFPEDEVIQEEEDDPFLSHGNDSVESTTSATQRTADPEKDLYPLQIDDDDVDFAIRSAKEARQALTEEQRNQLERDLEAALRGLDVYYPQTGDFEQDRRFSPPNKIKELLDLGACVDHLGLKWALHLEIQNAGRLDVIKLLVSRGAHVAAEQMNQQEHGDISSNRYLPPSGSLLPDAAEQCNTDVVQLLLDSGAKADDLGATGELALSSAARALKNRYETVRLLLIRGAEVNALSTQNIQGLFKTERNQQARETLQNFYRRHFGGNLFITLDETALDAACQAGHKNIVLLLLKKGAIAKLPTLCRAAMCGHEDIVEIILDHSKYSTKWSPAIYFAAWGGYHQIVTSLRNRGLDVNGDMSGDDDGNGPANGMSSSYRGWPLLHVAVARNQTQAATILISHSANVEKVARGLAGRPTPLQKACRNESADCVELLLRSGAEVDAKGGSGLTALQLARTRSPSAGMDKIIAILKQHGAKPSLAERIGLRRR